MKHLFDADTVDEMKARIARLAPTSLRQWGRMDAAQAIAHCALGLEVALGDHRPPRVLVGRLFGPIVKRLAFKDDAPMRRNSPTVPSMVVTEERDLDAERRRLLQLVERFAAAGPTGCTTHPHSFFGRLTPEEWAVLQYKHLDHHLRQFAV
jgi:hypothetical protein